jgi:hypothetical protein
MLKLAGIILLVVLILVGALMPLKYTARMKLPKLPSAGEPGTQSRGTFPSRTGPDEDGPQR